MKLLGVGGLDSKTVLERLVSDDIDSGQKIQNLQPPPEEVVSGPRSVPSIVPTSEEQAH